jgi:HD-GYP domain-containing protein (c-di-GMP phosphodiesterase class II)
MTALQLGACLVDNCLRAHARPRIGKKLLAMPVSPASALKSLQPAISMLARAHHHRDSLTCRHEQRVAAIAVAIARTMRLPANRIDALNLAALVHDIGQLGVPGEIVSKPDRLSDPEQALMQTHCEIGRDILQHLDAAGAPVAEIVYQHHERVDGSGYPRRLRGASILEEARILAVADTFDALSSYRAYRAPLSEDFVLAELRRLGETALDKVAVDACVRYVLGGGARDGAAPANSKTA